MATLTHAVRSGPVSSRVPGLPAWTIAASVAIAVACRIPFLGRAPGPDEAGFLLVGRQWDGSGTSLYGNYWVDRPPLLITIFRLAASTGGLTALRVIGCLAVAMLVLGCARVAGLIGGTQAARWAALTAAALTVSPMLGGYQVNGELLAAPFVVGGVAAVIAALQATDDRRAVIGAVGAGALAMTALLIKQNFAEVAVFGAVAYVIARWRGEISARRMVHLISASTAGAGLALMVVAWWTAMHGTSLSGVYNAMYPFRIRAGHVMAVSGRQHATERLHSLVIAAVLSGLVVALVVIARHVVSSRRPTETVWWAILATIGFGGVSVVLGGNYWLHYLVELIGPVAIAVGVLAARRRQGVRLVVTYAVAAAALAWGVMVAHPQGSVEAAVGEAVATSAHPGDTIFTAYGRASVVESSGLSSPYPHLWSLPVKTLDPQLTQLDAVLRGPNAPTYIVTWSHVSSWGLDSTATRALVVGNYHRIARVCGHGIYLRNGIDRAVPRMPTRCQFTPPQLTSKKEYQP